MAWLDELVDQITDASLRQKIQAGLTELKRRQRFGLVFEEHVPETTALPGLPIQVGSVVQCRDDLGTGNNYRVTAIDGRSRASLAPEQGDDVEPVIVPISELLSV